jgi:hypothetical protein
MDRIRIIGGYDDIVVHVRRVGRHVIVSTPRSGVAMAAQRVIVDKLSEEEEKPEKKSGIGFEIT